MADKPTYKELEQRIKEFEIAEAERKPIEDELLESKGKYQMLSDASFEGIVIHVDGLLHEANDQFFDMFGYRREELMGKEAASILITPESFKDIKSLLNPGMDKGLCCSHKGERLLIS